jgi:hypothetical protein
MSEHLDALTLRQHRRRALLRRLLRHLPRRDNAHRYPVIRWFGEHARQRPYLWSFKRPQIVPALYAGWVISLLPIYGAQILVAFAAALLFRANLTVTVALQFVTNPLTIVPVYAFTGWIGTLIMDGMGIGGDLPVAMYYANALMVGGFAVGLLAAFASDLLWRFAAWEAKRLTSAIRAARRPTEER